MDADGMGRNTDGGNNPKRSCEVGGRSTMTTTRRGKVGGGSKVDGNMKRG